MNRMGSEWSLPLVQLPMLGSVFCFGEWRLTASAIHNEFVYNLNISTTNS